MTLERPTRIDELTCHKCGFSELSLQYRRHLDKLFVHCPRCDYNWFEEPLIEDPTRKPKSEK